MLRFVIEFGSIELVNLRTITRMNFEEYLIFSLSKDRVNQFSEIPKYSVIINKNRKLCITSLTAIKKESVN